MIDPKQLTESDKGRKVIYRSPGGYVVEEGVLTSWNSTFVFVRFLGPNGEACVPEDVSFAHHTQEAGSLGYNQPHGA